MIPRTDLAAESAQMTAERLSGLVQEDTDFGQIGFCTVKITDQATAAALGKAMGEYLTVTTPPFHTGAEITEDELGEIARRMADVLPTEGLILVVGLGNNEITPDAIGPRTIHKILATRHIGGELKKQAGLEKLRPVAALAPGVLGQTGIESSEIVGAIVRDIQPAAVVVIDALAARSTGRLGCTIQIANTGISPGSGVMNSRKELSAATLGVPVVSIGIPTVVDASTLAVDLLPGGEEIEGVRELFEPRGGAMMITPREIDALISHACHTLSLTVNKALQPDMTFEEIGFLSS
ncbi:MAG: GPR endopeptidase [Oscillospiraceae bacterium]|nr:GPR endopeptidase [Oscillospiraceae bacterium]